MVLHRLARLPFLAIRQLRWKKGSWSKESDREYHEQLYEFQDHDPFRREYPGYVTIRRFADHVEPLIPSTGTVLDVGCGPGEITCELARRHPALSFVGIDHSDRAIQRATRNAARLGLTNITFMVGDAECLPAEQTYGLVTMFDAFHHLERPRDFLAWLRHRTSRCVLVEPAGTWDGGWARGIDVDWLLFDLADIRERLESACGEDTTPGDHADPGDAGDPQPQRGQGAVERRYALDDFESFFDGWHLRVTGTLAGFDRYPPQPHARSALRPITGEIAYTLIRAAEDCLVKTGRDRGAKHWVIAATTEAGLFEPRMPRDLSDIPRARPPRHVKSRFDVRYRGYDGPTDTKTRTQFRASLEIVNAGWDTWQSDAPHSVRVSYHWLTRDGDIVEFDGVRSDLPRPVGPGDQCRVLIAVTAPAEPGTYVLAIDLVKEGVTWFSEAGIPWHTVSIRVRKR